ncbi:hypothetical protein EDC65_1766 [Stella humosa]|uniref:Uncharacterized protein n=1 Tax=Stella humosa TaxID=94 RepID=A0A3N1M2M3_9PROT|nr:hypothetical protein [Stella humosa]ROP99971.1 hypothetical protein EDC65_1766 [Stella humosa]BBK30798.1 hypothetical protein STHU_14320 [Stella humosa]
MPAGMAGMLLGLATGGGALLMWYGLQRLRDRALPDGKRRQGWWGINLGLLVLTLSMLLFSRS